jgi:hypothetical protein
MNRKDIYKLVTFVLSIACAVSAAAFCHYSAERVLRRKERALRKERTVKYDESVDGPLLIDQWKQTKSDDEQRRLWMEWTQLKLGEEPWWFSTKSEDTHPLFLFVGLLEKPRELEKLKSDGWQTMDGGSMHLTPEQVWYLRHNMKIYQIKDSVESSRLRFWVASMVGSLAGFCGIWIVYVAIGIAWPALMRICR